MCTPQPALVLQAGHPVHAVRWQFAPCLAKTLAAGTENPYSLANLLRTAAPASSSKFKLFNSCSR